MISALKLKACLSASIGRAKCKTVPWGSLLSKSYILAIVGLHGLIRLPAKCRVVVIAFCHVCFSSMTSLGMDFFLNSKSFFMPFLHFPPLNLSHICWDVICMADQIYILPGFVRQLCGIRAPLTQKNMGFLGLTWEGLSNSGQKRNRKFYSLYVLRLNRMQNDCLMKGSQRTWHPTWVESNICWWMRSNCISRWEC